MNRDFGWKQHKAWRRQFPKRRILFHFVAASDSRIIFLRFQNMLYAKPEDSQEQIQEDLILLHRIYPNLNSQQLLEAKENLDRYFDLAVRIFLRLEQEEILGKLDPAKENSYDPNTKVDSPT